MHLKFEPLSPLTPIRGTRLSQNICNPTQTQQSHSKTDRILQLYSKFITVNNQVSIDYDLSAFNLIQYNHKEMKMDLDQQMIVAKLKRLENNAQLKRINMELQNRKKKVFKQKLREYHVMPEQDKYLNTYREFKEQNTQYNQEISNHSDSDQENQQVIIEKPKGIAFFTELKKHPRVLEYTVDQVRSRQKARKQLINSKELKRQQFKNQIKKGGNAAIIKLRYEETDIKNPKQPSNPQKIADNIFRKIYTKRNKQKSMDEIKQDQRLNRFVNKQQMIVDSIEERSLSKQLYKKLKQRLNDIATELYVNQKKHQTLSAFPKFRMNRTINIVK